jgi:hypothetical protein
MKLAIHFHLVPMSRIVELYLHSLYVFISWYLIDYPQGKRYFSRLPSYEIGLYKSMADGHKTLHETVGERSYFFVQFA